MAIHDTCDIRARQIMSFPYSGPSDLKLDEAGCLEGILDSHTFDWAAIIIEEMILLSRV